MTNLEIKKILVPVDFSELSDSAVKTATSICERQNASMVLMNVLEPSANVVMPYGGMNYFSHILKDMEEAATMRLKIIAGEINSDKKIIVEIAVRSGNVFSTICSLADETNADMIVMGTHGASGLREFFIGSNAYSVVKHSQIPVLTVPSTGTWTELKKILFPMRMQNSAFDKYETIRSMIQRNDSVLMVLGLVDNEHPSQLAELKDLLNRFKFKLAQDNIQQESELYYGDKFPDKVLEAAHAYNADLIVITSEIDHSIKDFFIGPYAQQIVNHSGIPVLTIRPKAIVKNPEVVAENSVLSNDAALGFAV